MRRINTAALRKWLHDNGDESRVRLAYEARISASIIEKMATGLYPSVPRQFTRERICQVVGISEDELFPLKGKKAS